MNAMPSRTSAVVGTAVHRFAWHVLNLRHWIFAGYLRISVRSPLRASPLPPDFSPERILILRLDEIGDFILTTPFLRAIRKRFPDARITLLVNSSVQALAKSCPYIDELVVFPVKRRSPPFDQAGVYRSARQFAHQSLRDRGFDCALIPRADIDNAGALAMAYHAGIPHRIGFTETTYPLKAVKNRGYDRFLTHALSPGETLHEVPRTLDLARALGADVRDTRLELWPSDADEASADALLKSFREPARPLVAFGPGAGIDRRQWPAVSFAELGARLVSRIGAQIVIVGGPADESLGREIASRMGGQAAAMGIGQPDLEVGESSQVLNLAGRTSLGVTAAVLARCTLFVGNDSGPMHMAAGMRTPCVEVSCHPADGNPFGANSPLRFSPWKVPHRVLQPAHAVAPCRAECVMSYAHCIRSIEVDAVFAAATGLLSSARDTVPASAQATVYG